MITKITTNWRKPFIFKEITTSCKTYNKIRNMFLNAKKKQQPTKISDNIKVIPSKLTEIEHHQH